MKKLTLTLILTLSFVSLLAQTGWQYAQAYPRTVSVVANDPLASALDRNGNLYSISGTGGTDTFSIGSVTLHSPCGYVTKSDTNGVFTWVLETPGDNNPLAMALDATGNVYIVGAYTNTVTSVGSFVLSNHTSSFLMYYLAEVSASGTVLWAKNLATEDDIHILFNYCQPMGVDNTGNLYLAAYLQTPVAVIDSDTVINDATVGLQNEIVLMKFGPSGSRHWIKKIGPNSSYYSIKVAANTDIFLTGSSPTDSLKMGAFTLHNPTPNFNFLVKLDSSGQGIWGQGLSQSIFPYLIALSRNYYNVESNSVYVSGLVTGTSILGTDTLYPGLAGGSPFISKFNSTGSPAWARGLRYDAAYFQGFTFEIDNCGNIFFGAGSNTAATAPVVIQGHTLAFPSYTVDPSYILQFDTTGTYITGITLSSLGDDYLGVLPDNRGNFYLCGDFESDSIVLGSHTLMYDGHETAIYAKYRYQAIPCISPTLDVTQPRTLSADVLLYPNPAANEFTLASDIPFSPGTTAELYDITGRLMNVHQLSGESAVISTGNLVSGMYQCRVLTSEHEVISVKKLVIMK